MKYFFILTTIVTLLLAKEDNYLIVKDSDVSVKLNGTTKTLQQGTHINLTGGDSICFLSGDGRIIINDYKQLNKDNKACFIVPVNKDVNIKELIMSIKDKVYVAYFDSTETLRHGASAKGAIGQELDSVLLQKGQDLLISSNQFGPLPVEISIYNESNILLDQFINEDESITFLRIPNNSLKNEYKIKIINGFKQELMKIKIVLEP